MRYKIRLTLILKNEENIASSFFLISDCDKTISFQIDFKFFILITVPNTFLVYFNSLELLQGQMTQKREHGSDKEMV